MKKAAPAPQLRYKPMNITGSKTLLLLAALFLIGAVQAHCTDLASYIRKYERLEVSEQQMAALADHNHLIDYFASLPYIQPRHRVNADFIRALILAESNANPLAVSPKQALGLGQILYPTGRKAARELLRQHDSFRHVSSDRLRDLEPADLHDPAINILLTCYLVAKYNKRYGGRLDLVVSAWNAGEGSVIGRQPAGYTETLELIARINAYFISLQKMSAFPPQEPSRRKKMAQAHRRRGKSR